jgi:aminocarboxymuconate-semialdehyde decarboxylase
MRSIDIHAHLMPQCLWHAVAAGREWYGTRYEAGDGLGSTLTGGQRSLVSTPKLRFTPEQRLEDMDAQGVDVQVVSIHMPLVSYHLEPAQGRQLARDVNDEIATMTRRWPQRFAGLATLPVQDIGAAIDELDRAVHVLGLKGAELDTAVNGDNWDDPRFRPLFRAAEAMGALLFFHPQPHHNLLLQRTNRYGLANSIGVIVEDALIVAILIFGGILDACPELKVCIAHGGGPACFGMGRLDRGWQVRAEARRHIQAPPSTYQRRLYYDCVTGSEAALRFLIDTVGPDRVVLGSDWPFVGWDPSPAGWVQGLQSLTQAEKDKILWQNLEALLGLSAGERVRPAPPAKSLDRGVSPPS